MNKEKKKLKLNIKGNIVNFWTKLFLKYKIQNFGVEVHTITDKSSDHVEIVVSGEKDRLWEIIKGSKGQDVFLFVNEVIFEFADVGKLQ